MKSYATLNTKDFIATSVATHPYNTSPHLTSLTDMASQPGGEDQGSPLTSKYENSPWFQEFLAGIRGVAPALSLPDESPLGEEILNPTETEFSDGEVVNITFQIEMFTMMVGMRQQIHELTNTVTELTTTVKSLSNNARDLSTNVAASTAKIIPQTSTAQKESRTYAEAAAAPKETHAPKTPPKGKKRSATVGPTPPKNPKQKQKKEVKAPEDAAEPANDTPPPHPQPAPRPKTITIARRRIYGTRATPIPLPNSAKLEPQINIAIAKELQKWECSAPTILQIQINATTGTVSLTTPPGSELVKYTSYLAPMTTALNAVLPEGSQDYMEFRRAPTNSQVVIHGLSLEATSNDEETMLSVMKESLFVGQQVNITSARFLQKDPEIRLPKKFTSVVVAVLTDEVDKITPSVLIHGRYKASSVLMWHSNPTKQGKKCYQYGHPEEGCKATHHTCPICAGEHRLKEHKCTSPTCHRKGNSKIIADCCPVTPSKSAACGGNHPAYSVECPIQIQAKQDAKEYYDRSRASQSSEGMDTTK